VKYILTFILSIFTFLTLSQDKIVSSTYLTFDNEYQNSVRKYVGYDKNFIINRKDTTKENHVLDVIPLVGWRCYFYKGQENRFIDYRVSTNFRYDRNFCINANVSFLNSSMWSPVFFDGLVRYTKKRYSSEFFFERESVGTPIANELRYSSTSTGLSLDYRVSRKLTVVNSLAYNGISDGNNRWFHSTRLIYTLKNNSYIDLKLRRMIGGEWSPYYFSPNQINQYNFGYGFNRVYKRKLGIKLYFGMGIQKIDDDIMLMSNYDLRLNRTYKKWYFEVSAGTRNFNTYIFNTVNTKITYTIGNK